MNSPTDESPRYGLHRRTYPVREVIPYINWLYFFHAWGFPPRFATIANQHACEGCRAAWLATFNEAERPKAAEAIKLYTESLRLLNELDAAGPTRATVHILPCNSRGNDLLIRLEDGSLFTLPLLRQQSGKPPYLCLADFIRPEGHGRHDTIAAFAATAGTGSEQLANANDDYRNLLLQTLADRLAEATAEMLHEEVRKYLWGYAPDEQLTPVQLHNEEFQGIRPAVGYPSLPDISINRLLSPLTRMETIGINLTENSMMRPHASVSGLMFAHPQSRYFSVGPIGEDQLADYAARRDMPVQEMRKYLQGNLS